MCVGTFRSVQLLVVYCTLYCIMYISECASSWEGSQLEGAAEAGEH
jgi:hypothetical protein